MRRICSLVVLTTLLPKEQRWMPCELWYWYSHPRYFCCLSSCEQSGSCVKRVPWDDREAVVVRWASLKFHFAYSRGLVVDSHLVFIELGPQQERPAWNSIIRDDRGEFLMENWGGKVPWLSWDILSSSFFALMPKGWWFFYYKSWLTYCREIMESHKVPAKQNFRTKEGFFSFILTNESLCQDG